MPYKIWVFLEGKDDLRFFVKIVFPILEQRYSHIKPIKYSNLSPEKRANMIAAINNSGAEYVYVQDLDEAPCISFSKNNTVTLLSNIIAPENIIVVIREIECWYLCGLNENECTKLLGHNIASTESYTKNQFNKLIPKGVSRAEFMRNLLSKFNLRIGEQKNCSFKYFSEKWLIPE